MTITTEIQNHLDALHHPLKNGVVVMRNSIKEHFPNLHEHIKWNALSYQIHGEDFLTFNYSNPKEIRLVFHRGAKKKEQPAEKWINDTTLLLKWAANDRAIAVFTSSEEIQNSKENLIEIISKWTKALP